MGGRPQPRDPARARPAAARCALLVVATFRADELRQPSESTACRRDCSSNARPRRSDWGRSRWAIRRPCWACCSARTGCPRTLRPPSTTAPTASRSTSRSRPACSMRCPGAAPRTSAGLGCPTRSKRRSSSASSRSAAARELASVGAVIGRRFTLEAREPDHGPPHRPAGRSAARGARRPCVPGAGPRGSGSYHFRNQLLRDAIYAQLPEAERRQLHGLVGSLGGDDAASIDVQASAHFELAGMGPETFATALAGARAAARISSHRESLEALIGARSATFRRTPGTPNVAGSSRRLAIEEAARDETDTAAATLALEARGVPIGRRGGGGRGRSAPLAGVRHLAGDGLARVRPLLDEGLVILGSVDGGMADRVRGRLEWASRLRVRSGPRRGRGRTTRTATPPARVQDPGCGHRAPTVSARSRRACRSRAGWRRRLPQPARRSSAAGPRAWRTRLPAPAG